MVKSKTDIPLEKLLISKTRKFDHTAIRDEIEHDDQTEGVLFLDSNRVILQADASACQILSIKINDLIGQKFDLVNHNSNYVEIDISKPDGTVAIVGVKYMSMNWQKQHFTLAILRDISQQIEAKNSYLANDERLKLAIETTELGLWEYDQIENSTSVNTYYASMLGYKVEEFDPGLWVQLVHPVDLENVWNEWKKHLDGEIPSYEAEYRIRTKSGNWKWIRARAKTKTYGKDGKPIFVIGTHQDITGEKEARRGLELLYEMVEIANEFISLADKMARMSRVIHEKTSMPILMIHMLSDDQSGFSLIAQRGISEHFDKSAFLFATDDDIIGYLLQNKKPLFCEKSIKEEYLFPVRNLNDRISEGIFFPIFVDTELMGVLSVFWDHDQIITNFEIDMLQVAAKQLGIVIERDNLLRLKEHAVLIEERQRLARELHDSLAQSLYSLALSADGGRDYAKLGDLERTEQIFKQIGATLQQTLKEMRLLVYELRPMTLEQEGLLGALQKRIEMVEKRANIKTKLNMNISTQLPENMEIELHGIVQEALNNVIKHSGANNVEVNIAQKQDNIVLEIIDNGQGFNVKNVEAILGIGIPSIRERANRLGGEVTFKSEVGKGTQVRVCVPFD